MNKPLTIEQLKTLEVGDWVWIENLEYKEYSLYAKVLQTMSGDNLIVDYVYGNFYPTEQYGTKWLAYKNKEQAEKYVLQRANEPNGLYSIYERVEQLDLVYTCVSKHEAELRLAELKGEKKNEISFT